MNSHNALGRCEKTPKRFSEGKPEAIGQTLQDWVVMAKVTSTRIEAKNRAFSNKKAFNSIIRGIWGIHLGLSKKLLIKMLLKID